MKRNSLWSFAGATGLLLAASVSAIAQDEAPTVDAGDTAWMLMSTALVLLMTIPGLALFYAGMVRKKSFLSTAMQSFAITCLMTILWMVAGYSLASIANNLVHVRFGQRGVAFMGPLCHIVAYVVVSIHPPYPVLVVMFIFVGFGNGLIDAAWCAWIGNMANANEVQGFLQASYSLGATVSPLIATALIEKTGAGWYGFYYIMVSLA